MVFNFYRSERTQALYRKIHRKATKTFGVPCKYLPLTASGLVDHLLGEDPAGAFNDAIDVKLMLENVEFYEGQNQQFDRYGLNLQDEMHFSCEIDYFTEQTSLVKPQEGDVIAFMLGDANIKWNPNFKGYELYKVTGVQPKQKFFQFGTLYVYDLFCEKFTYSGEDFATGDDIIDSAAGAMAEAAENAGDNAAIEAADINGPEYFDNVDGEFKYNPGVTKYDPQDPLNPGTNDITSMWSLDEMLHHFRFEGTAYSSGDGVVDSADSEDGVAVGSFTAEASGWGNVGRCAILTGTQYVETGIYPSVSTPTMAFWVKFTTLATDAVIGVDGSDAGFYLGLDEDGNIAAGFGDGSCGNGEHNVLAGCIPGAWYRFVLTYSVEEEIARVYINGRFMTQFTATFASASSIALSIGAYDDGAGPDNPIAARIASFSIGERHWTADDVAFDWNASRGRAVGV